MEKINNKGYTFLELILVVTMMGLLMYSVLYIPTNLMLEYADFNNTASELGDLSLLRNALNKDLVTNSISKIDDTTLLIGGKIYHFGDNVSRESDESTLKLTSSEYKFILDKDMLKIQNDTYELKYNLKNSFDGGEDD